VDILANFERLDWDVASAGARSKTFVRAGQRARLLELDDGFVEPGWCTRSHAFIVLDGRCSLETREGSVALEKGAVGLIPGGEPHAHRLLFGPGERALLLVFDEVDAAV
jgi:quercetin dioxygenase-like cupin family protein